VSEFGCGDDRIDVHFLQKIGAQEGQNAAQDDGAPSPNLEEGCWAATKNKLAKFWYNTVCVCV
jgi:hypothetical protein